LQDLDEEVKRRIEALGAYEDLQADLARCHELSQSGISEGQAHMVPLWLYERYERTWQSFRAVDMTVFPPALRAVVATGRWEDCVAEVRNRTHVLNKVFRLVDLRLAPPATWPDRTITFTPPPGVVPVILFVRPWATAQAAKDVIDRRWEDTIRPAQDELSSSMPRPATEPGNRPGQTANYKHHVQLYNRFLDFARHPPSGVDPTDKTALRNAFITAVINQRIQIKAIWNEARPARSSVKSMLARAEEWLPSKATVTLEEFVMSVRTERWASDFTAEP
jgi:hypothetical protein